MNIVKEVTVLEYDMKEFDVVSDLMVDFPLISKEDNPEVLAAYVVSHFEVSGDIINYSVIPDTMGGAPLRVKWKRKSKKVVEESEPKPKKEKKAKRAPKLVVTEPTLPAIQDEVADLGPVEVLSTRTRGGSSGAASQKKPKDLKKKGKKQIRKLKVSTYTEEEDAAIEASSLVIRKRSEKVAAETSSDPQTVVQTIDAESLQDQRMVVQDEVVIETTKSLTKELGTSVAHLVEKKTVDDA